MYNDVEVGLGMPPTQEKQLGVKRQKLEDVHHFETVPVPTTKPKMVKKNRFNIDESILKRAEEDSELLDSLCEISEKQLYTQREEGQNNDNHNGKGGLLESLLENGTSFPPFDFD